jgi:hypothetical protein
VWQPQELVNRLTLHSGVHESRSVGPAGPAAGRSNQMCCPCGFQTLALTFVFPFMLTKLCKGCGRALQGETPWALIFALSHKTLRNHAFSMLGSVSRMGIKVDQGSRASFTVYIAIGYHSACCGCRATCHSIQTNFERFPVDNLRLRIRTRVSVPLSSRSALVLAQGSYCHL